MSRFSIFMFILLPSFNSLYANNLDTLKQNTEAIEVHSLNPLIGDTYYRVYHSDPFVLYRSQYFFSSDVQELRFNEDETQISAETDSLIEEVRFKYTIFHKDSVYGYVFHVDKPMEAHRVRVDSAVKIITGTNRLDSFLTVKPDSAIWNKSKKGLREIFRFPAQKDFPALTIQLFYDKSRNGSPFSLNERVDSVKKMKLYKVEVDYETFYDERQKMQWPAFKDKTEMNKVVVENVEEPNWFLNRYRQITTL